MFLNFTSRIIFKRFLVTGVYLVVTNHIIKNFDALRKKERDAHIKKVAAERGVTVDSIIKDLRLYRKFRNPYIRKEKLLLRSIQKKRMEELEERRKEIKYEAVAI